MVELSGQGALKFDPDIPPEEALETIEAWQNNYSVESLSDLNVDDIESEQLLFENRVDRLKAKYRPGRLAKPIFLEIAGKEPLTQEQAREVREHIELEADKIRMNFKRAKGRVEKQEREKKRRYYENLLEQLSSILKHAYNVIKGLGRKLSV